MYCLFDFLNQIPCFCGFCFLWVCLSATSWVFAILPCYVLLLFVFMTFCIPYFDYDNSFCGVREVFLIYLLGFVIAFFAVKISVLHQSALARFAFFVFFFPVVRNCVFGMTYPNLLQPLPTQNYRHHPPRSTFSSPQSQYHFFAMVVCCKILSYAPIPEYFYVVSRSPRTHISHCTHVHS